MAGLKLTQMLTQEENLEDLDDDDIFADEKVKSP